MSDQPVTQWRHRPPSEPSFVVQREDWTEHAACRGMDPNLFFPDRGQDHLHHDALAVCQRCPVAEQCLDYAIRHHERGIWGNTTGRQRQQLRRRNRVA